MSTDLTLRELKKISKILLLANSTVIEAELSKIASTNDRKKIWVLIDGTKMPVDIAREAEVTAMTVSNFLNAGKAAQLIEYKKGEPPQRMLEYVPPSWIDLLKITEPEQPQEQPKTENKEETKHA